MDPQERSVSVYGDNGTNQRNTQGMIVALILPGAQRTKFTGASDGWWRALSPLRGEKVAAGGEGGNYHSSDAPSQLTASPLRVTRRDGFVMIVR